MYSTTPGPLSRRMDVQLNQLDPRVASHIFVIQLFEPLVGERRLLLHAINRE